jgi:hypothetical protein
MKISGFTFVRNASKLFIPAKEAIASILPLVDEFVVALGKGDPDDTTEADIKSLKSDKVRFVYTAWPSGDFPHNTIFAQQTDIAKENCKGDWLFYLQCDEAVHQDYLPLIKQSIQRYHKDLDVEGLLFKYKHFWGDFDHYNPSHSFYPREIRVIRNLPQIHSWRDAQSFRYHLQPFTADYAHYQKKEGTRKLNVAQVDAYIYHYGWVRPPALMVRKQQSASETYRGKAETEKLFEQQNKVYRYGPLHKLPAFRGTHPKSMEKWIAALNWQDELQYSGKPMYNSPLQKHEKAKYRWLTWVEQKLLNGKQIGEFKNFKRIR